MNIKQSTLNRANNQELSELMLKICEDVAKAIAPTYGPYGANALIQSVDTVYSTKDGWTVLQNLTYGYNGVYNGLKKLIQDCAQSVLLLAGDGTSTVSLLAYHMYYGIYKEFIQSGTPYNVKELENALKNVINGVIERLALNAKEMPSAEKDPEELRSVIQNIALISTNWDMEMATLIADVYSKTSNPIIKFENSGTEDSYVKYIEGFDIRGELLLSNYYTTDPKLGECNIANPAVLMFNHAITKDLLTTLVLVADIFHKDYNKTLVVFAPDFQADFINGLMSVNMTRLRDGQLGIVPCVPFKYYKKAITDKDCVEDLCILFGTDMISKENPEMSELFMDLKNALEDKLRADAMTNVPQEEINKIQTNAIATMRAAKEYLSKIAGTCDKIILTDKYALAQGFTNANDKMIEERRDKLKCEITNKTKEASALGMITEGIRLKRVRLGKLQLNMGVIYVGGYGDANLKSKRDALDDATKACEAAYKTGYTIGGGIATLIAIDDYSTIHKETLTSTEKVISTILSTSYINVIRTMFENKWGDKEERLIKTNGIISNSIAQKTAYNLITENFDDTLIIPLSVEIEILRGVMNLISVMVGSNQLIFRDINSIEDVERVAAINESGDVSMETQVKLLRS